MKQKFKKVGIFLIFAIPLLYFLFTVLFFSPFEEPFGRLDYIIPREVDCFLTKAHLENDFYDFPVPKFYSELEINRKWRTFTKTELYRELEQELALGDLVERIRADLAEVPVDAVRDVIGRELAVAGNYRTGGELPVSYLVFFRASWKVKLAYELLTWGIVRSWSGNPDLENCTLAHNPEGYITLILPDEREFYLKRESDLVVVGDSLELMRKVCELHAEGKSAIDRSLGGSQGYFEKVASVERQDTNYIDFHLNVDNSLKRVDWDEKWKTNDTDFSVMTAMKIFDTDFYRSITGALHLGKYIDLNAKVEFYTENVHKAKTGFFGVDSIAIRERLDEYAAMLPDDTYLAACARVDLKPLLTIMDGNLEPELKKLIDGFIADGRQFNRKFNVSTRYELIDLLTETFKDTVWFSLRPRDVDKPIQPGIQPLPIIALVFEIENGNHIVTLEETLRELQSNKRFKFEMWQYKDLYHNCRIKGFNPLGTDDIEQIAYTVLNEKYFILSTSSLYIKDMLGAMSSSGYSLKEDSGYGKGTRFLEPHGNLALYIDAVGLKGALDNYSAYWAWQQVEAGFDTTEERAKIRRNIIQRRFRRYAGVRDLPQDVEDEVTRLVEEEMLKLYSGLHEGRDPEFQARFMKYVSWIDLMDSLTLTVNVNRNDVDLGLRIVSLLSR